MPDLYWGVLIGIVLGFHAGLGWALRKVEHDYRQRREFLPDIEAIFREN